MKKEGIDLKKMEKAMRDGQRREFEDGKGRPYVAVKNSGNIRGFMVFYNKKWLPPDREGWQRMHMVEGGDRPAPDTLPSSRRNQDSWNILGYTTVARRKREDGGWDYRIEEAFDLKRGDKEHLVDETGSPYVYKRSVPYYLAYAIKKIFPKVVFVGGTFGNITEIGADSRFFETAGKAFKMDISMRTNAMGNIRLPEDD